MFHNKNHKDAKPVFAGKPTGLEDIIRLVDACNICETEECSDIATLLMACHQFMSDSSVDHAVNRNANIKPERIKEILSSLDSAFHQFEITHHPSLAEEDDQIKKAWLYSRRAVSNQLSALKKISDKISQYYDDHSSEFESGLKNLKTDVKHKHRVKK